MRPGVDPSAGSRPVETLVAAFRGGERDALADLHAALKIEVDWVWRWVGRRQTGAGDVLEPDDLRQETWLVLAEAVRDWDAARDGPFPRYARQRMRRRLERLVRASRANTARLLPLDPGDGLAEHAELRDGSAEADAERWADGVLARDLAAALTPPERRALLMRVVEGQRVQVVADRLCVSRRGAERLLRAAQLRARAAAGELPPAWSVEGRVLAVVHAEVDRATGRAPSLAVLTRQSGFGLRRVRETVYRLAALGYLRRDGRHWLLARARDETHRQLSSGWDG